ncbi:tbc1 domain family member 12 [Apiospora hydei]|uniref:Tbc1 domain family member 12 n=1 Tax=Apiospora hydei TaxID=1337664 RepID=A0ABR1X7I8_9PEZI
MNYETDNTVSGAIDLCVPSPGSPPGMISSKTSRASSLRSSIGSDDDNHQVVDVGNFEEIGLEDDTVTVDAAHSRDLTQSKNSPNPYSASYAADLRSRSTKHVGTTGTTVRQQPAQPNPARPQRDITSAGKGRPPFLNFRGQQFRDTSTHNLSGLGAQPHSGPAPIRGLLVRSSSTASASRRQQRSPSPNLSLRTTNPRNPSVGPLPRRRSWQSAHAQEPKKTSLELEREFDEQDDDDHVPEGFILDNVPISPRPMEDRTPSRPVSTSTSPERSKSRVRSVGNGTPLVPAEQGSLRSPSWRSDASSAESIKSPGSCPSPLKGRAKSWNAALSELSAEARSLTEKLEEHAAELDKHGVNSVARPAPKPRVKSALAELPPLRRTNIMIDPLPISKEKEAVLSRTRPSWLPPKDPAEEKKHIKEYQRMMVKSIEADKRRTAAKLEKEKNKDDMSGNTLRIWEEDVLPRWKEALRERRTRELWWKGVAPRSRGAVWTRAIGNELGLTETSFHAALARAHEMEQRIAEGKATTEDERRNSWFSKVRRDVKDNTWVDLKIFQAGGPLHDSLVDVLKAYAMYRSDIGYVSGMNTIAATLLLNLPSATASFIALANMLNRPLPLSFIACDNGAKHSAYNLLLDTLSKKSSRLHAHLTSEELSLDPELYLAELFSAMFTQHLSLDDCSRLWDVYVFEGDSALVRAGVALLLENEGRLLAAKTQKEVLAVCSAGHAKTLQGRGDDWMLRVRSAGKA